MGSQDSQPKSKVQRITDEGTLIAIVIRREYSGEGIEFFSDKKQSQQLGYMHRPQGYRIAAHRHKLNVRRIPHTEETLFVRSGKVEVDLYRLNNQALTSVTLGPGDVISFVAGGHGLKFLEASELIEVKQGPYTTPEADKEIIA